MPPNATQTARARVRAEMTREILVAARRQLAEVGAASLSVRAITRDLEMSSSAIYRYFPSREALITALIIDAYNALGAAAEKAEAKVARDDFGLRFKTIGHAVRNWALANPHEYALIYGTPVPGYKAPEDTIVPATRVTRRLLAILQSAKSSEPEAGVNQPDLGESLEIDFTKLAREYAATVPPSLFTLGLAAWIQILGTISFEIFGHFNNVIADNEAYFDQMLTLASKTLDL
ncbi:MAG: TetR/AcrR family transcriptional regulator [Acidobacteria bacterium]|nr:TetR/AcrR family transcriptional regulator [Acidobacteriota bacterium]